MATPRATAPKPDLFPFLAVLVCTMGALIFLLIAFSARIRTQQAAAKPTEDAEPVAETPAPVPAAARVLEPAPSHPLDALPRVPAQPAAFVLARPPQAVIPPSQTAAEVNAPLEAELDRLLATKRRRQAEIDAANAEADDLRQTLASRERSLAAAMQAADETDRIVAELRQKLLGLEVNLADLKAAAGSIEDQIDAAEATSASRARRYEFVTVDRISGTRRHPVVVVCRADRWQLPVEEVDISADLAGYTTGSNPLAAAVKALSRHYERNAKPYVLLVVPPEGTTGYNLAASIFRRNAIQYGYELVPDDLPLNYPAAKADATAIAKSALEGIKRNRGQFNRNGRALPGATRDGRFFDESVVATKQTYRLAAGPSAWDRRAVLDGRSTPEAEQRRGAGAAVPRRSATSSGSAALRQDEPNAASRSDRPAFGQTPASSNRPQADQWKSDDPKSPTDAAAAPRPKDWAKRTIAKPKPEPKPVPAGGSGGGGDRTVNPSPDARSRLWGRTPSRWLGFEKRIAITVQGGTLHCGSIHLENAGAMSTRQLRTMLIELADRKALEWGEPSGSVFWRPTLLLYADPQDRPAQTLRDRVVRVAQELEMGTLFTNSPAATQQAATRVEVAR